MLGTVKDGRKKEGKGNRQVEWQDQIDYYNILGRTPKLSVESGENGGHMLIYSPGVESNLMTPD